MSFLEHLKALWAEEVRRFEGTEATVTMDWPGFLKFGMKRGNDRYVVERSLPELAVAASPDEVVRGDMARALRMRMAEVEKRRSAPPDGPSPLPSLVTHD